MHAWCRSLGCLVLSALLPLYLAQAQDRAPVENEASPKNNKAERPPLVDPFFLLVQDESVREELQLTEEQRATLDEVLRQNNRLLLSIRDSGPQLAAAELQKALNQIRRSIYQGFESSQRKRMLNMVLQAQGYGALFRAEVVTSLKLEAEQLESLNKVDEEFQQKIQEFSQAAEHMSQEERQDALQEAQQSRHRQVLEVLDERQKKIWAKLLGEPFDLSQVKRSPAWAPEFEEVETWINSPTLTMESLRGRVVVVHFFAFGCINCIRNYPWYNEWYENLQDRDVTIIGIHTPETQREYDVQHLRESLEKHNLQFPVAVDNAQKNWQAWSNNIWPAVYVIDKRGRVRDWWYGELNWEGAGGHELTRKLIDELLAEE